MGPAAAVHGRACPRRASLGISKRPGPKALPTPRDVLHAWGGSRAEEAKVREPWTWTVEIIFTEDDDKTRADAVLSGSSEDLRGWGRSRRNPLDPDLPAVGEEI